MNLKEIHHAICELEDGATTFSNCAKLADLYIVRENFKKEYKDTAAANGNGTSVSPTNGTMVR